MGIDRFVSSQFCDDVRHEIGGKYSLIGCYGGYLQVSPIPSVLPKLCAFLKAYTSVTGLSASWFLGSIATIVLWLSWG